MEDEWERLPDAEENLDLLFIRYDSQKTTVAQLQQEIAKHSLKSEVVPAPPQPTKK